MGVYLKHKLPDSIQLKENVEEEFMKDDFKVSPIVPALYEKMTSKELGHRRYNGKMTPERYEAIIKYIRAGAHITHAAHAVGVTYDTIREWVKRGKEEPESIFGCFVADLEGAKAHAIYKNLQIVQMAAYDDWKAAQWLLSVLDPEVYSSKTTSRLEITGAGGQELKTALIISDEELKKMAMLNEVIEEQNKIVDAEFTYVDENDKYKKDDTTTETTSDDVPDVIPQ